jgi:NAD-reducing hydrogenase small subunit
MNKKKLATVWLGGCSGCHMSFLDIDERILEIIKLADIIKCPIVDQKEFPENVDIVLVEGAVCSDEHFHELKRIRKNSKTLISFGDCAVTGNVSRLRNSFTKEEVINCSYVDAISNDKLGKSPNHPMLLKLNETVVPLHEVVHVDYFIHGCPPSADQIYHTLIEFLNDRVPETVSKGMIKHG